ncbi:hypothetical protein [Roseivirga sp.]|uniref:hypothetical protein n=1 Tax=Roseivirga sp. TaxID=1964215 RepID=UPI003B523E7C
MRVLIVGGTRLLGKSLVDHLVGLDEYAVTVLSRRAGIFSSSCRTIVSDRDKGIDLLKGEYFDWIIDFIAYDDKAVFKIKDNLKFGRYLLISSCWMPKLNLSNRADQFIHRVDSSLVSLLPDVTMNYLLNKREAELFLETNFSPGTYTILRLPIFLSENDHTGRIDFYVSRLLDDHPIIAVNAGQNYCQIGNVPDLAAAISYLLFDLGFDSSPILEALPSKATKVIDVIQLIRNSLKSSTEIVELGHNWLEQKLPIYLKEEPLWREIQMELTEHNIFKLIGRNSLDIEEWLPTVAILRSKMQTDNKFELRAQEIDLINS